MYPLSKVPSVRATNSAGENKRRSLDGNRDGEMTVSAGLQRNSAHGAPGPFCGPFCFILLDRIRVLQTVAPRNYKSKGRFAAPRAACVARPKCASENQGAGIRGPGLRAIGDKAVPAFGRIARQRHRATVFSFLLQMPSSWPTKMAKQRKIASASPKTATSTDKGPFRTMRSHRCANSWQRVHAIASELRASYSTAQKLRRRYLRQRACGSCLRADSRNVTAFRL